MTLSWGIKKYILSPCYLLLLLLFTPHSLHEPIWFSLTWRPWQRPGRGWFPAWTSGWCSLDLGPDSAINTKRQTLIKSCKYRCSLITQFKIKSFSHYHHRPCSRVWLASSWGGHFLFCWSNSLIGCMDMREKYFMNSLEKHTVLLEASFF